MSENVARRLDFSRKLLLTVAGLLAIALPFVVGLLHATPSQAAAQASNAAEVTPGYETASIQTEKPQGDGERMQIAMRVAFSRDGFAEEGNTMQMLVSALTECKTIRSWERRTGSTLGATILMRN